MNNNENLKAGTKVLIDGRVNGVQTAIILKRETMKSYNDLGGDDLVYYELTVDGNSWGTMMHPASDILEVL